jgi:putative ABC transport system permease protein
LFLIESVILAVCGGILGVILCFSITRTAILAAGLPCIVPLWSVIFSFSLSVLIGIVSGVFPARRAADLDPVEALRYG